MVSLKQLAVPSAAPIQISLSANPYQLKTERLEKQFAPLWRELADQLKVLFHVRDEPQRSTLADKSSASKIEETELENQCSNLLFLEADKH